MKLAIYGPSDCGEVSLLRSAARIWGKERLQGGEIGGVAVHRVDVSLEFEEGEERTGQIVSMSGRAEYEGVVELLLREADCFLLLFPADLKRAEESRVLLSSFASIAGRLEVDYEKIPLVVQYNWRSYYADFYPEQLDAELGIHSSKVKRVLGQEGDESELTGVRAAMELCYNLKLSPR